MQRPLRLRARQPRRADRGACARGDLWALLDLLQHRFITAFVTARCDTRFITALIELRAAIYYSVCNSALRRPVGSYDGQIAVLGRTVQRQLEALRCPKRAKARGKAPKKCPKSAERRRKARQSARARPRKGDALAPYNDRRGGPSPALCSSIGFKGNILGRSRPYTPPAPFAPTLHPAGVKPGRAPWPAPAPPARP